MSRPVPWPGQVAFPAPDRATRMTCRAAEPNCQRTKNRIRLLFAGDNYSYSCKSVFTKYFAPAAGVAVISPQTSSSGLAAHEKPRYCSAAASCAPNKYAGNRKMNGSASAIRSQVHSSAAVMAFKYGQPFGLFPQRATLGAFPAPRRACARETRRRVEFARFFAVRKLPNRSPCFPEE